MEVIRSKFEELDVNCDGLISYKQLKKLFDPLKISGSLKRTFKILDTDGNRVITYDEFIIALVDRENLKLPENIEKCFAALDMSNNGKLSLYNMETEIRDEVLKEDPQGFRLEFYKVSKGKNYVGFIRLRWKNLPKSSIRFVKRKVHK